MGGMLLPSGTNSIRGGFHGSGHVAINPNHAMAWTLGAWLRVWRGEPELALEHVAHAMRLNPLNPRAHEPQRMLISVGQHDAASSCAESAMRDNDFVANMRICGEQCACRTA
jgi:hypothetical protein